MIFEEAEAPQSYKDFKKSILHTIEDTEIEADEVYPGALFTQDREGNEDVIHLSDIAEDEEEASLEEIVHEILPDIIRRNNSKYFAFVFSGEKKEGRNGKEIVAVLSGSILQTDMVFAEVNRKGLLYAELDSWQKEDYMSYSQLVAPLRQGIVYQG